MFLYETARIMKTHSNTRKQAARPLPVSADTIRRYAASSRLSEETVTELMESLASNNAFDRLDSVHQRDFLESFFGYPYMDPTADWAFKYIFSHEANIRMFLSDLLGEDITAVEYDFQEIPIQRKEDKKSIVDVRCHTTDGRVFVVEMQARGEDDERDRLLYYAAGLIRGQKIRGDKLYDLNPVYCIMVCNFLLPHDPEPEDKVAYRYEVREQETGERLSKCLNLIFVELPRCRKRPEEEMTNLEEWLFIFRNMSTFAEVPERFRERYGDFFSSACKVGYQAKQLKAVMETMITEYEKKGIESFYRKEGIRIGREEGRAEGLTAGLAKGRAESMEQVALAMREAGEPAEKIALYTGLTLEQIQAL